MGGRICSTSYTAEFQKAIDALREYVGEVTGEFLPITYIVSCGPLCANVNSPLTLTPTL
jgi:hypothetical protein